MTLNIERLTHIAEWLENGALHSTTTFDMEVGLQITSTFMPTTLEQYNQCGTKACIAGAAVQFFNEPFQKLSDDIIAQRRLNFYGKSEIAFNVISNETMSLLGLTNKQADDLFLAEGVYLNEVTAAHAAACIRHLIATGEVDWIATQP